MLTKEALVASEDSILLDLVDKSKGHTGKDFSEAMDCDFSYTFLTGELTKRGYKNGWYKEQIKEQVQEDGIMVIDVTPTATKTVRKAYTVSEEVAEKWSDFTKGVPGRSALMDKALTDFMTKAQKGKVEVKFELGKQSEEQAEEE